MKKQIKAAPDCILIEPLEEKTTLVLTQTNEKRILRGKVLDIGQITPPDTKTYLTHLLPIKENMIVYFLSYEGNYDNVMINNKTYYMVLVKDLRGYEA